MLTDRTRAWTGTGSWRRREERLRKVRKGRGIRTQRRGAREKIKLGRIQKRRLRERIKCGIQRRTMLISL